ncbi:MAG: Stp1/IreP family PP2C-type Ser/Thr phosphatase [Parachlamydiaceae bacterium]|nr:Stp1/IreP family PP2C-type Ser/Thr phosphatase [Parachlamydiaceae bacterium]
MVAFKLPYTVSASGHSDVGLVRQNNEDVWVGLQDPHFYVLADGMGGHQAGEVAARDTAMGLCEIVKAQWGDAGKVSFHDMRKALRLAIEQVNRKVYKKSRLDPMLKGMGTTLCCVYFHPKGVIYAHVGDSRIYRLRNTRFEQLTKDHSLCRDLVDQGQITEKQAPDYLYRNIITKAIGTELTVEPSVHLSDLVDGDLYLMCSDGLSDLMTLKEMHGILNQKLTIDETVNEFVATANARGGHDNITVVIMKVSNVVKKDIP